MRKKCFSVDMRTSRRHTAMPMTIILFFCGSALIGLSADRLIVNSPIQPTFADLETAATFTLPQPSARNWKLEISGALTASNRLECCFGFDANSNAVLEANEILAAVAWESGEWAVLGGSDLESRYTAAPSGTALRLDIRFGADGAVSETVFRDSGQPLAFGSSAAGLLNPKQWNLACLKARGFGDRAEVFQVSVYPDGTAIKIR